MFSRPETYACAVVRSKLQLPGSTVGNSALVRMRSLPRLRTAAKEAWGGGGAEGAMLTPGHAHARCPNHLAGFFFFFFFPAGFSVQLRMSRCPAVAFREAAGRCTESRFWTFLHRFFTLGTEKLSELFAFKYFPGVGVGWARTGGASVAWSCHHDRVVPATAGGAAALRPQLRRGAGGEM